MAVRTTTRPGIMWASNKWGRWVAIGSHFWGRGRYEAFLDVMVLQLLDAIDTIHFPSIRERVGFMFISLCRCRVSQKKTRLITSETSYV